MNLTLDQAANLFGCSKSRVEKLVAAGELLSFRIGARRLVREEDAQQFIAAQIEREQQHRSAQREWAARIAKKKAATTGGRR